MMKSATLLLFLLACVALVNAQNQKAIFILAGQSNMAGRGGINYVNATPEIPNGQVWDHYIPPECQSNPHILRLNANLTWVVANEPLHADIDSPKKTCGVGPGMAFANEALKRRSSLGVIGLVPCAKGGTGMFEWGRGTILYNRTMKRAAAALRGGGKLHALLWYQGEFEAETGVGSFAMDVPRFFMSLREDLKVPRLPIIQVALPPNVLRNYTKEIRNIQLNLKLPFLTTVDAIGSELNTADHVHLTTPSQVKLGKKMAMAFVNMIH
ncbi:PREDICTED: probable carbohydrate esterase At4g34215 [Ipomoea nil]|uniref:probable carbohydrate esterase At4g34215 n=1 Tax=Ipomoea nil TaxID=35883 RepID=UPI000901E33F|nr:PREDICTED: probable carbohydrate esterase At4g34215 [Ipomoea nil]